MKRKMILPALILAISAMLVAPVFASGPTHSVPPASSECPGGTLILTLNFHVINDYDSGLFANWALDHFGKQVQVYQMPSSVAGAAPSYCAYILEDGGWHTFAGALSPQAGVTESRDAAGNFNGFLVVDFTATDINFVSPSTIILSTKDYGGTAAAIISHGSGPPPAVFDWLGTYFSGASITSEPDWAFYYYMGNVLEWTNAITGNIGDIVV